MEMIAISADVIGKVELGGGLMPLPYVVRDAGYTTPCWEWRRALHLGYGWVTRSNRQHLTHRLSYEAHHGSIPEGLVLDHLCKNRACMNPSHLEPVTNEVNIRRARHDYHGNDDMGFCPYGHEMTGHNLMRSAKRGQRRCRTCSVKDASVPVRPPSGERTHCPRGHEYSGRNLIITKKGYRACRACKTAYDHRRSLERKAA